MIKLIECPRDAMQGLTRFVPTELKARYINQLLKVGFDTIDFGSFVSPKAIPQLRDTREVLAQLELQSGMSKLLSIVANKRGAEEAASFPQIDYLGYPFSVSETFQLRNTNATIEESLERVKQIQEICIKNNKTLVVYLSMGFGNPYGDPWNTEIVSKWVDRLATIGISIMALSDTIGIANPQSISYLFDDLIPAYPNVEFGAHFHTKPAEWKEKVDAAYGSGCKRFDSALKGYGGCPMAKDELTGNMSTENLIFYFLDEGIDLGIDLRSLLQAEQISASIFPQ